MPTTNTNGAAAANDNPVKYLSNYARKFIAFCASVQVFDAMPVAGLCVVATAAVRGCA